MAQWPRGCGEALRGLRLLLLLDPEELVLVDLALSDLRPRNDVVDDLVLVQSEPGPVILAAATPEGFKEYGRLPALSSKTWNHPTLAGRYLLVRNDREAVCYELKTEG